MTEAPITTNVIVIRINAGSIREEPTSNAMLKLPLRISIEVFPLKLSSEKDTSEKIVILNTLNYISKSFTILLYTLYAHSVCTKSFLHPHVSLQDFSPL